MVFECIYDSDGGVVRYQAWRALIKYILGGEIALAVHICVLGFLVEIFGFVPLIATSIGFVCAVIINCSSAVLLGI